MVKILVVDDDRDSRDSLAEILETSSYQVDSAANGKEALAKLAGGGYELVITDIFMPEMHGYELVRRMHQIYRETPVIVFTGGGPGSTRLDLYLESVRTFGAVGFQKPLDYPLFLKSVAALVG